MKKRKNNPDQIIIEALDALDKSTVTLRNFAPRYDAFIDKALLKNDEKTAKKYINQKLKILDLGDMFETLKGNLQLGACTSKVVSSLGTLPAALSGCKGLLNESPNFAKISSDIRTIFSDIQASSDEISKLNHILDDALSPAGTSDLETALGLNNEDISKNERFQAELAEASMRIHKYDENVSAAAPTADLATGEFDISKLIDEENRK